MSQREDASPSDSLELEASADSAQQVKVARRMWYGGFAGLPMLWLVSYLHFRSAAHMPGADAELKKYVNRSLCGAVCGGVVFVVWVFYVQLFWRSDVWLRSLMITVPELPDEL